jgi:putative phosphonate metabolism protein
MAPRYGLYYAPAPDDPLWRAGTAWLGRDPETGADLAQPDLPDLAAITAEPRLYGFHATLKPPMALRPGFGWQDVLAATEALAAALPPFALPELAVTDLGGLLALCETTPCAPLQAAADACIAHLDHLRAPPTDAELARRRRHGALPPAEEANLQRWGYMYAFATWRFHMTLTRRLTAEEKPLYRAAAEGWFADALVRPRQVEELSLFIQPEPGAPFALARRVRLRGQAG